MSLRVLMVVASEDDGGMARVVHLLASRLPAHDCSVHVAVHREAPLTRLLREAGVPYSVVPELIETPTRLREHTTGRGAAIVRNLGGLPRAVEDIRRLVAAQGTDIVYSHNTWSHYVTASAISGLRTRGVKTPALAWHIHNDHSRWPARLLDRLAARVGDVSAFIAVSRSIGEPFAHQRAPLSVVTNGIDLSVCDRAAASPCMRSMLAIDAQAPVVVYAGRLVPHKGFEVFLEAAHRAASSMPDLHAVILGGNPRHERRDVVAELRAQVEAWQLNSRVHVLGHVPDVERYIADADVAAVPSLCADGFPLAAVEALCLGVPVIASAIGGLPELVRDGVDGVLVQPGDPAALGAAMVTLVRDRERRRHMSEAAKAARPRFDAAAMAQQVANILRRAAASKVHPTAAPAPG